MMDRWHGRVALVTGAASGIGAQIAQDLANSKMCVIGCDIELKDVNCKIETPTKGHVYYCRCDVSKESDILEMFEYIKKACGTLDVVVCCAGIALPNSSLLGGDTSSWKAMLDVNVLGYTACAREAVKLMKQKNTDDGHIFMLGSTLAHSLQPGRSEYNFYTVTKCAIKAVVEMLRYELREEKSHIRVTEISPGRVYTNLNRKLHPDLSEKEYEDKCYNNRTVLQPSDVSEMLCHALCAPPRVHVHDIVMSSPHYK